MPLLPTLLKHIEQHLTVAINQSVHITSHTPVSGGSINDAYCLHTSVGSYMLKVNSSTAYPDMFRLEQEGLAAIRNTHTVAVPQVVGFGDVDEQSFLVLEWIETGTATTKAMDLLGQQLAAMHRHTAEAYGLGYNNYMGSLAQSNHRHATWNGFFIQERLQPMVELATSKHLLTATDSKHFEQLYLRFPGLFNEEKPSLLHGDLWGGNYLISSQGQPYLIDPAVSYGNREFDIAMTTLFGGFGREFYQAYHEAYPLEPGWQQRLSLWNLYPLLLHLNLFGTGYLGQVRAALQQYL